MVQVAMTPNEAHDGHAAIAQVPRPSRGTGHECARPERKHSTCSDTCGCGKRSYSKPFGVGQATLARPRIHINWATHMGLLTRFFATVSSAVVGIWTCTSGYCSLCLETRYRHNERQLPHDVPMVDYGSCIRATPGMQLRSINLWHSAAAGGMAAA